jgi:hypothetical protein
MARRCTFLQIAKAQVEAVAIGEQSTLMCGGEELVGDVGQGGLRELSLRLVGRGPNKRLHQGKNMGGKGYGQKILTISIALDILILSTHCERSWQHIGCHALKVRECVSVG